MENGRNLNRGRFITFEGLEGSGKSTHVAELAKKLRKAGKEVLVLREPGGRALCEKIRTLLKHEEADPPVAKAELLLFLASRAQLVEKTIKPALENDTWVVCDRFSDSTMAYQCFGRKLASEVEIASMDSFATGGLKPDLTMLLDVPVYESSKRVEARAEEQHSKPDRIERSGEEFFERVRRGFMSAAATSPERFVVVDASRPQEETASEIWSKVSKKFALRSTSSEA